MMKIFFLCVPVAVAQEPVVLLQATSRLGLIVSEAPSDEEVVKAGTNGNIELLAHFATPPNAKSAVWGGTQPEKRRRVDLKVMAVWRLKDVLNEAAVFQQAAWHFARTTKKWVQGGAALNSRDHKKNGKKAAMETARTSMETARTVRNRAKGKAERAVLYAMPKKKAETRKEVADMKESVVAAMKVAARQSMALASQNITKRLAATGKVEAARKLVEAFLPTTWQLGAGCGAYPEYGCQSQLNDVVRNDLSTLEECQAACEARPTCLSIDWYVNRTDHRCNLSDNKTCSLTTTSDCRYYGKVTR